MNFVRIGHYLINLNQVAYLNPGAGAVYFSALAEDQYMWILLEDDEMNELVELIQKLPMRTTMV